MNQLRNIALVAHVDHGKTTLVDALLRATGTFAAHQAVVVGGSVDDVSTGSDVASTVVAGSASSEPESQAATAPTATANINRARAFTRTSSPPAT